MMTTKTMLITSDDPKGLDATAKWRAVYNKAKLTDGADGSAQRLNESPEFWKELAKLILEHSVPNKYANEVTSSKYIYPDEYKGPKLVAEQVKFIAEKFGLDPTQALEYAKTLPDLPEGAEGWFAVPKISAVASKHFSTITDPFQQYCEALLMAFRLIKATRNFYNYRESQITPSQLRVGARAESFLEQLEADQPGDILIIAAQLGMRHRGKSVRRARETFVGNEFGVTSFIASCIVLVHPERLVRWEELDIDCAGDEFAPDADGVFSGAPIFHFSDGRLKFDAGGVSYAYDDCGSASAFAPQN